MYMYILDSPIDISNGIIYHLLNKSLISRKIILHILIFALLTIIIISIKLLSWGTYMNNYLKAENLGKFICTY